MDIETLCEKLRPIIGKKADRYWLAYLRADYQRKKEIEVILNVLYSRTLKKALDDKKILLTPPPSKISIGDYLLGNVVYNDEIRNPFFIKEEECIQHVSVLGRSGSGKTNLIISLLLQFIEKKKPFLCIDWKKNYREIIQLLPDEKKKHFLIFTVGKDISPLKFNPLIPPEGTHPKVWLKQLISIIGHAYYGGDGVMYLLQKAIDAVYTNFKVYEEAVKNWPTMHNVLWWLEDYKAKGREANWMSSTIRALASMCFGGLGEVLRTEKQGSIEEILTKNCIMELDALTEADKIFFIESLLLWIHHYRLAQSDKETFKHALIIEEAHHILLKQQQELKGGETIVDVILREIRELGEAIFLVDQCAGQISTIALANSYCTVAFNTKHQSNVTATANCMLFNDKSRERDYLGKLPVGTAIIKLQDRYTEPFLIQVPLIKLNKGSITDNDVQGHMRSFSSHKNPDKPQAENLSDSAVILLNDKELKLIKDINEYNISGIDERYRRLGFSSFSGNAVKKALAEKELIKTVNLPNFKGRLKILELTDSGIIALRQKGIQARHSNESAEHRYWKEKVANYYRKQGYEVITEYRLKNGKRVDVVVKGKKGIVAFEIETGKSNIERNIKKSYIGNFNLIVLAVTNKLLYKKISTGKKILFSDFTKKLKK